VGTEQALADLGLGAVEAEQVAARLESTDFRLVDPQARGDRAWIGRHQAR
jgi:hypothetical protein